MLEDFDPPRVTILARELRVELEVPFTSRHQLVNLLAAVAAAQAVGVEPSGRVDVQFGALRGEHVELPRGVVVINDCYNANPLSMRAALDDLATQAPAGGGVSPCSETCSSSGAARWTSTARSARTRRRPASTCWSRSGRCRRRCRRRSGARRTWSPMPPRRRRCVAALVAPGDVVLVKASRGIGLETVAEALAHG